jgi:hypothetical protein
MQKVENVKKPRERVKLLPGGSAIPKPNFSYARRVGQATVPRTLAAPATDRGQVGTDIAALQQAAA